MATFVEDASLRVYYGSSEGLQQRVEVVGVLALNGSEGEFKDQIPASLFNLQLMTGIGHVYFIDSNKEERFVIDDLRTSLHATEQLTGDLQDAPPGSYNVTIIGIE